jgi:hypothetical protein
MRNGSPLMLLTMAAMLALGITWAAANEPATVSAILTSAGSRTAYLAHATIWKDPGVLSPDDILDGPSGVFPYTFAEATADEGIGCTFATPGKALAGNTPKFLCTTSDGRMLWVKYWDPELETGNREVFATVAATRLMWALGFEALQALPMNVRCDGCPRNPMTGDGARSTHRYLAELQAFPQSRALILSHDDRDQGWSWREFDEAINALPQGSDRMRQRTHFDALTLLGVFMQHGDRKPGQQFLYCDAPVNLSAGEIRGPGTRDRATILLERPSIRACPQAAAMIVDVGATFGGAGRTSSEETAKMNLDRWRSKTVFRDADEGACRGRLTVSLAAGRDGEPNPVISEDGRRFLLEQLRRLTPAHLRALFTAARVDRFAEPSISTKAGDSVTMIDEWVASFEDKVRQIETHRCPPAS